MASNVSIKVDNSAVIEIVEEIKEAYSFQHFLPDFVKEKIRAMIDDPGSTITSQYVGGIIEVKPTPEMMQILYHCRRVVQEHSQSHS